MQAIFLFRLTIKQFLHQKTKVIFLESAPRPQPCGEATEVLACMMLLDGTLRQECASRHVLAMRARGGAAELQMFEKTASRNLLCINPHAQHNRAEVFCDYWSG